MELLLSREPVPARTLSVVPTTVDAGMYKILAHNIGYNTTMQGWPSATIEGLFDALERWALDPRLAYSDPDKWDPQDNLRAPYRGRCWGSCTQRYDTQTQSTRTLATKPIWPDHPNAVRYCSNFLEVSFGFWLDTDDQLLIDDLDARIARNMQRPDFLKGLEVMRSRDAYWRNRQTERCRGSAR